MKKSENTKLGTICYENYPLIFFKKKKMDFVLKSDVDDFLNKFRKVVNRFEGPFTVFSDGSNAKWVSSDVRDYFGVGIQVFEKEYQDRHLGNYIYVSSLPVFIMVKLISGFIKPSVPFTVGFNHDLLKAKAEDRLEQAFLTVSENTVLEPKLGLI